MSDNTLTIVLEGDVQLNQFTQTLRHLQQLVELLAREVAGGVEIQWFIEELQGGSALATIVGIAEEPEPVLRVVDAANELGQSLQYQKAIPYSPAVAQEARALTQVVGDRITEMRLITSKGDSVIYGVFSETLQTAPARVSFSSVKGRVQAISSRGNLKFTLYDTIFDKPVTCFLTKGQEEELRDIWGKQVIVSGRVTRGTETGQPKSIREITSIDPVVDVLPGSYKRARGILAWKDGDEPAEVSIRRTRDVED